MMNVLTATRTTAALAIALCLALPAAARESQLNVAIEGDDGARVRITLPLSSLDTAADLLSAHVDGRGDLEIDGERWTIAELRDAWREMRRSGGESTVRTRDGARIRIKTRRGLVSIAVDDRDGDRVELRLPSEAVDALFAGDEDELDLAGALRAMADIERGEIVAISDDEERVRVWVDEGE